MELSTSGEIEQLDLSPIVDLLPALRDEWAGLRFDGDGHVINPLTGEPMDQLVLTEGAHRRAGAVYRVTYTMPVSELPEELREDFDREADELMRTDAEPDAWDDHLQRYAEASVVVGTEDVRATVVLRHDDSRRLAVTVHDDDGRVTVDVDVDHARLPVVSFTGDLDPAEVLDAGGPPWPLARFLVGVASWHVTVDLTALERGGRVVEATAGVKRFDARAQLSARATGRRWAVTGDAVVSGTGLGRLVLRLAGGQIKRLAQGALDDAWDASDDLVDEVAVELAALRAGIDAEGGPAPFVRRLLWDEEFDGSG